MKRICILALVITAAVGVLSFLILSTLHRAAQAQPDVESGEQQSAGEAQYSKDAGEGRRFPLNGDHVIGGGNARFTPIE